MSAPFKCCGCGAPAKGRSKPCFCITICGYRSGEGDKTEYTTFTDVNEPDENGWIDISTAPKDRFLLLSCGEDKSIWFAKWQGDVWHGVDEFGLTREGHSAGDSNFVTGWFVERWQPLPAPPSIDGEG
ncbi:hypothetical protein [Mesorhizobium ciceri]|uniref:hypothetical protein n=1 Tax=Mesorhizobium TaxID=68287 RepID=UPI00047BA9D8|nr:hypothetical protein [Mesorhizobium ciceri]